MSSASSSRASQHQRVPYIPIINCPYCGLRVKRYTSRTHDHNGWVFFKCEKHAAGCNFWHWELDYVIYLLDSNILRGEAGLEALGWAEERQLALKMRAEEDAVTKPGIDEVMMKKCISLLQDVLVVLKLVVLLLLLLLVLMVCKK